MRDKIAKHNRVHSNNISWIRNISSSDNSSGFKGKYFGRLYKAVASAGELANNHEDNFVGRSFDIS